MSDAAPTTNTTLPTVSAGTTSIIDKKYIYAHPTNNPRSSYSDENWEKLVTSLKAHGQLLPVVARIRCDLDGEATEGFLLVMEDGHSRLKARGEMGSDRDDHGRRADDILVSIKPSLEDRVQDRLAVEGEGLGLEELAALKTKLIAEEKGKVSQQSHAVNTARESWNCWGEANSLKLQIDLRRPLHPELSERELQDSVGELNGMKGDLVRMRLSLLDTSKTPKDIQDKLRDGELEYSAAIELRRITDAEVREDLSEKCYLEGWSANMLKKKIDKKQKDAEASGSSIKATRKRASSKKSSTRGEEEITDLLEEIKDTISDLSEDEDELLNQLLGAVAAIEWIQTPSMTDEFMDSLDRRVEKFYEDEDSEDSEDSEESESGQETIQVQAAFVEEES